MGELYALICALLWGVAVILLKRSGETVPPFALNLFRVVVSSILLVATVLVLEGRLWHEATREDLLRLFVSGLLSIALADTFFHRCLNAVGAGITAIVDCLYSPLMSVFAFMLLGEVLDVSSSIGLVLVVSAVLLSTRITPPTGATRAQLVRGILWGAAAMACLTFGVVVAKPALTNHSVLWATTVRQVAALVILAPVALISPRRREWLRVFRPNRDWRFSLTGTFVGSYLALLFWLAGMKYTQTGVAAILNQTSTIYVLILASLFLGERFTRRKAAAAGLAFAGILMVTAF